MLSSAFMTAVAITIYTQQGVPMHMQAPQDAKSGDIETTRIDPSTSQPFPITIPTPMTPLPSSCKSLHLVGLGVRTVSFLRIQVYVAGLYIDSSALNKLSSIEGWNGYDRAWMMDSKEQHSGEKLVGALLDQGITCAIRIGECLL